MCVVNLKSDKGKYVPNADVWLISCVVTELRYFCHFWLYLPSRLHPDNGGIWAGRQWGNDTAVGSRSQCQLSGKWVFPFDDPYQPCDWVYSAISTMGSCSQHFCMHMCTLNSHDRMQTWPHPFIWWPSMVGLSVWTSWSLTAMQWTVGMPRAGLLYSMPTSKTTMTVCWL